MKADHLRKSILQMAIQGKLVPQDPNDEPAAVLLEKIKAEKESLIKQGKIKKDKPLPPIADDEKPFDIPDSWEWVRLGDLANKFTDGTHSTPKYTQTGIPFLSVKDMSKGYLDFTNTKFISREEHEVLYKRCNPEKGDLLITKVGTTGVPVIVNTDKQFSLFVSVALMKFSQQYLSVAFLCNMINSPLVQEQAKENTRGVGNKNWVLDDIRNTIIPLPPLNEQKRIVEAIEKFEPLLAEYDKLEQEATKLDSEIFDKIKKSVLQYAIQGKLVPQDSSDEPASALLAKIKAEKESLIKQCKIKKEKPLPPITDDEKHFDIPDAWEWVRLGNIITISSGKNLTSEEMKKTEGVFPVYGGNGVTGYYNDYNVEESTIIIGRVGFYCGSIHITNSKSWVTDNALIVRHIKDNLDLKYLALMLKVANFGGLTCSTAQPLVTGKIIKPYMVAIPPLNEQKRIVARIEEIFAQIDKIKIEN